MACRLCIKLLPINTVESLDRDLKTGNVTMESLAEQYDVEVEYVTTHYKKCLGEPARSGYELLQRILEEVTETTKEMRQSYDPSDADNKYAMGHYIKLVRELRETVATMNKLKPSGQILQQITDSVMNPLVSQFARICVEEIERHRNDLISNLGREHRSHIDKSARETLRRLADRYKRANEALIPQLKTLLQDDQDKSRREKASKVQLQ